jgi:hypothetical protein
VVGPRYAATLIIRGNLRFGRSKTRVMRPELSTATRWADPLEAVDLDRLLHPQPIRLMTPSHNSFLNPIFLRSVWADDYLAFKDTAAEATLFERLQNWASAASGGNARRGLAWSSSSPSPVRARAADRAAPTSRLAILPETETCHRRSVSLREPAGAGDPRYGAVAQGQPPFAG